MGFEKFGRGWEIAVSSLRVLNSNKQLIVFPILSGLSMVLIATSFLSVFLAGRGWQFDGSFDISRAEVYGLLFLFYVVNYFIAVFFNMSLMHCTKLYFDGEEATIGKGLQFSVSRIGAIFAWAVFSATVGIVLRLIQDNLGWVGKLITSLIGIVWSVASFFAIPVIAYENVGPVEALKRSAQMMKNKWGESIGASFSFGFIIILGFLAMAIFAYAVSFYVNDGAGIGLFALGICFLMILSSALHSIFISAVYNNINGNINQHFNQRLLDGLFERKE